MNIFFESLQNLVRHRFVGRSLVRTVLLFYCFGYCDFTAITAAKMVNSTDPSAKVDDVSCLCERATLGIPKYARAK